MMDRIEKVILRNLVYNEEYLRKVIPFIEPDYFNDRGERIVFEHITKYVAEYNSLITKEILKIEVRKSILFSHQVMRVQINILRGGF